MSTTTALDAVAIGRQDYHEHRKPVPPNLLHLTGMDALRV